MAPMIVCLWSMNNVSLQEYEQPAKAAVYTVTDKEQLHKPVECSEKPDIERVQDIQPTKEDTYDYRKKPE